MPKSGDSPDLGLRLYRAMLRSRRLDLRIAALVRQGRVKGAYYSSVGNEATAVGYASALESRDVLVPTHRDLAAHLVHGHSVREILLQVFKRRPSVTGGRDVGLHLGRPGTNIVSMVSHIAHMLPVAVGVALAEKMKESGAIVLTTVGDGGTSMGDFHESLNAASVMHLPVVFVIENNHYAYSTPTRLQYACEQLALRGAGYGMPGEQVDGSDVFAVREATQRAVSRARAGQGPTLLECITLRLRGHSEHDDASYVPKETLAEWNARDPIARLESWLAARGVMATGLQAEIDAEIEEAVVAAEAAEPAQPEDASERVYANWSATWRPPSLR